MSRNAGALKSMDMDGDKARYRSQGVEFIDVPVDPIVQEHEVFHDSADVGSRKLGTKLMAEKAAGSGVFFRAFVMNSKVDRVLLHFPTDLQGDPVLMEWVYKTSSRIHRTNSSTKSTWKYQQKGAWTLTEKSKKKTKNCKRGKMAHNPQTDASPPSPECDDDEEPERKKRSTSNGEVLGLAIESPWVETPVSRWFQCHMQIQDGSSKAAQVQASVDSRGPTSNQAHNSTPQGSADDACHSTQHVEEAMLSVDSADQHRRDLNVRLSCTGLDDSQQGHRLGEQACQLRFERDFEDDGSNSEAMPHNSPSASGCEQPVQDNAKRLLGKGCESHAWSQDMFTGEGGATGSPSNASGSDEQICFKPTNYMQLPSTASLSANSCEAFQSCR